VPQPSNAGGTADRGENSSVPFMTPNTGSDADSPAEIWIDNYYGERVVDSAEIHVQFLPPKGKQEGAVNTTQDSVSHSLHSRIESHHFA
jgi:hypothetical protein